jgi:hypothetical protein
VPGECVLTSRVASESMAAPEYVPSRPLDEARAYGSPPRRDPSWYASRPGEVVTGGQPRSDRLANPGPDQGYALHLVGAFEDRVKLAEGERWADAAAGAVAVGLKRASLFGRAPVRDDIEAGFTIWAFFEDVATLGDDLVAGRRALFAEVANPHHYRELRAIADAVPAEMLSQPLAAIVEQREAEGHALPEPDQDD